MKPLKRVNFWKWSYLIKRVIPLNPFLSTYITQLICNLTNSPILLNLTSVTFLLHSDDKQLYTHHICDVHNSVHQFVCILLSRPYWCEPHALKDFINQFLYKENKTTCQLEKEKYSFQTKCKVTFKSVEFIRNHIIWTEKLKKLCRGDSNIYGFLTVCIVQENKHFFQWFIQFLKLPQFYIINDLKLCSDHQNKHRTI